MTQPTEPKEHVVTDSPSGKFYFCNGLRHSYDSVTVDGFNCCLCGKPLLSTMPTMEQWEASLSAEPQALAEQTKPGCPTCHSPQPHLHPAIQHEGEVSICKDPFHSQVTPQNPKVDSEMPIGLIWGEHQRPDLHASAQEQAIVTAAREWAAAWGKVWEGDESATTESENEVNDRSKALHDTVLDLEREIVLRRRRAIMPGYDQKLEDWLS